MMEKLLSSSSLIPILLLMSIGSSLVGTYDNSVKHQKNAASKVGSCKLEQERDCSALLQALSSIHGRISFSPQDKAVYSRDFGNLLKDTDQSSAVAGVLFPAAVSDIVSLVKQAFLSSSYVVSARGAGHSIQGQARPVMPGIVVDMTSIKGIQVVPSLDKQTGYADVHAGELWVDVVRHCIDEHGLAPRSFTDYLHLSVGGTLSNAGISGQAFRFGPQIANVMQLDVVTGKGELVTCSAVQNPDLFFGVLGGLGQFGIITKARILLEKAPSKVTWIRALYADFQSFTSDQESLIRNKSFDYVEGFVIVNKAASHGYQSVPFKGQLLNSSLIPSTAGPVLYCLELVKKQYDESREKVLSSLLAPLKHVPSLIYSTEVTYFEFLNRVHDGESKLRELGLWQAAHPWINLFVARSGIADFDAYVFKQLLKEGINGPMIVYPLYKLKWESRMSAVTPDEDVFYVISILRYALPSDNVSSLLLQNQEIMDFCRRSGINFKQYLPHYTNEADWKKHFGSRKWSTMVRRKSLYDPRAILSTGQRIFKTTR